MRFKQYVIMKKICGLMAAVLLMTACVSCSDMILNDDGTISNKNGTLTLSSETAAREPETAGSAVTQGSLTIETVPETETEPSMVIGDDPFADAAHTLYVEFLNTGKSDSILVRADGKVLLVDTGENDDWGTVDGALSRHGITAVDCLIITHYDNDHIGTAARLLEKYPVGTVYMPDYVRNSSLYRKLAEKLETAGAEVHRMYNEDAELDLGQAHVWINATGLPGHEPGREMGSDVDNTDADENNFSLITYLTFGQVSLLLCGDAEGDRMNEYMPQYTAKGYKTVTLCKIPHHGASADKGELAALDTLRPRYCVVHTDSTAHVMGAMVTKMKAVFAAPYYTCGGTVVFSTDGQTWRMGQS